VLIVGVVTTGCIALALLYGKQLNALALGEEEARYLGVDIRKLKVKVLLLNVTMIAVSTAFTGVIGFVGLIVPHLLRMMGGSDNRRLVRNSVLLGAIVLTVADLTARVVLRPAELPIGIVTSIVGVPVFIFLLKSKQYYF